MPPPMITPRTSNLALSIPFATVSPNRRICLEVLMISFGTAISPFLNFELSKLVLVSVVFCPCREASIAARVLLQSYFDPC